MVYIVKDYRGLKEYENIQDVYKALKKACAIWCIGYEEEIGQSYEELYEECLKQKDFGDIAKVFEIDCFFKCGKSKVSSNLYTSEKHTPFICTRIF